MTTGNLPERQAGLAGARQHDMGTPGFVVLSAVIVILVLAPIAALVALAAQGSGDLWPHLVANDLPVAFRDTAILIAGTAAVVVVVGVGTAWLVTAFDFPGRRYLDWALLLPLAVPTYIVAYAYLDILHPIGPVQTALRFMLGLANPHDLWFPEVRSLGGAILLFGFVLYPYVYLSTRAMFLMQTAGLLDAARSLGAGPPRIFFRIALPLARPAIVVGASLALMETLNDVGASEFLGVRTLTVSIYSTWINRANLPGAAQIALLMLLVIVVLVVAERLARQRRRYAALSGHGRHPARQTLTGWKAAVAVLLGALPIAFGFLIPGAYLVSEAGKRIAFAGIAPEIIVETGNTLTVSLVATGVAVLFGLCIVYTARLRRGHGGIVMLRLAGIGYAMPGTVLAVGLLAPLAAADNLLAGAGFTTGLFLSGSGLALIYAYVVRFLAISAGGIESGFEKIARSLDQSARTLGHGVLGTLWQVHLPLIRPALGAAALLVFVDCMKELPATLLLRPLNFETLATHLYGEASRGTYEDGSIAALAIVLVGLLPVILLARFSRLPTGIDPSQGAR